jgi:hypothetical protein
MATVYNLCLLGKDGFFRPFDYWRIIDKFKIALHCVGYQRPNRSFGHHLHESAPFKILGMKRQMTADIAQFYYPARNAAGSEPAVHPEKVELKRG